MSSAYNAAHTYAIYTLHNVQPSFDDIIIIYVPKTWLTSTAPLTVAFHPSFKTSRTVLKEKRPRSKLKSGEA